MIMDLREQGKTYREIGVLFGIGKERIRQICCREEWRRSQQKNQETQGD
jgi:DNA-directed RNA polymerase sigma subunit (sigma70/sigma32)